MLKRKIQAGDIYRDELGIIIEIGEIESENLVLSKCNCAYDKFTGKYNSPEINNKPDLDLSKRYKLVEIDDAD